MKKMIWEKLMVLALIVVVTGGIWSVATAGNITDTGWNQKDQVTFYNNVITMCNELKADYNLVFANNTALENLANETKSDYNLLYANVTSLENLANEIKGDYNTLFADYTALLVKFGDYTGGEIGGDTFSFTATATASPAAAGTATTVDEDDAAGSATTVSTTDLTLTGL